MTTKKLLEFYLVKYLHVYFFISSWLNNSLGFENGTNVGVPLNVRLVLLHVIPGQLDWEFTVAAVAGVVEVATKIVHSTS